MNLPRKPIFMEHLGPLEFGGLDPRDGKDDAQVPAWQEASMPGFGPPGPQPASRHPAQDQQALWPPCCVVSFCPAASFLSTPPLGIRGVWKVRYLHPPHHTMFLRALAPSLGHSRIKVDSLGISKMIFLDKDIKMLFKVNQALAQPFISVGR